MEMATPIEELRLSSKSYNCLKTDGIDTVEELMLKLDEGILSCMQIPNMGWKSLEEILYRVQGYDYPSEILVEQYIAKLREDPESTMGHIETMEAARDKLKLARIGKMRAHNMDQEIPLNMLVGMPDFLIDRFTNQGILTVDELLNQYKNEDELPMPPHLQQRVLRILDQNHYRFDGCPRKKWPDINDYIEYKRALSFSIETLELPAEIEETLKKAGITMLKIVNESSDFLKKYLSNIEITVLLYAMDVYRLRTKDAPKAQYPDLNDFIAECLQIPISDLNLPLRIRHRLRRNSIDTLAKLQGFTRQQLIERKIVGSKSIDGFVQRLRNYNAHLAGDKIYTCAECNSEFIAAEEPGYAHYCSFCTEKSKRIKKIDDYVVTIDGPNYGSYADDNNDLIIFATIHNKTKELVEVKLRDFTVFCSNRQWTPTNSLPGYNFVSEHIMPVSSKTAAKVWAGNDWKQRKLQNGDYIDFSLSIKGKVHSYKFVLKNGRFEIDDYFIY